MALLTGLPATIADTIGKYSCQCVGDWVVGVSLVFGLLYLGHYVLGLLCGVVSTFMPGKNLAKYGKWAIVTGATDGIGKAYAFQLARKGVSVVLISRSQEKLDTVAAEIKTKHSAASVKTIAVDFSKFDDAAQDRVAEGIKGLEVGVLVNNVGVSYKYPMFFGDLDRATLDNMVALNVTSVLHMTRIVLPGMVERRRGLIVNVSSVAATTPVPMLAVYGATKQFVINFSKNLHAEYSAKGIHVQAEVPFFVSTALSKIRKTSLTVPSPAAYARAAVATWGRFTVCCPYWSHALQRRIMDLVPDSLMTSFTMSTHLAVNRAGKKKEAAAAAGKKDQ